MVRKQKIRVRVYFNQETFKAVAADAEKAGKRRGGLQLFTQKPHGFASDQEANTDGISKFLKHCWQYWREAEHKRLAETAEAMRVKQEAEAKLKSLGHVEK